MSDTLGIDYFGSPAPHAFRIAGGRLIDPANGVDAHVDVAIEDGRVVALGAELDDASDAAIDATGLWVMPGLVDLHVHLAEGIAAPYGHAMLARAGVTTALELGGRFESVLQVAADHGAGLTIAGLDRLGRVDRQPSSPTRAEARQAFDEARRRGAIGLKVHVDSPLSPDGLERAIGEAEATGSWIAAHCGTTATRSDLTGLRETLELAAGRPVHVAHVNSYCRGALADPRSEADDALSLLAAAPSALSEAYLSPWNGNWGGCRNGMPEVARVGEWLAAAGFPATEDGLGQAIVAGAAAVVWGDPPAYVSGQAGLEAWLAARTRLEIGFPINPFDSRVRLATVRDEAGFVVPAIATDGGAIPRNVTLEAGLALVALGGLSPQQLVTKASWAGARALGLSAKGHLGAGADADVAIVDPVSRRVVHTIAGGRVVVRNGRVIGSGSRVLCPPGARDAVLQAGCTPLAYDPASSGLRTGDFRIPARDEPVPLLA